MSKAILSVVRFGPDYDDHMDQLYKDQGIEYPFDERCNGKYIKAGAAVFGPSETTDDLQKAQVFGFSKKAQRRLFERYIQHNKNGKVLYEVIPVKLQILIEPAEASKSMKKKK